MAHTTINKAYLDGKFEAIENPNPKRSSKKKEKTASFKCIAQIKTKQNSSKRFINKKEI